MIFAVKLGVCSSCNCVGLVSNTVDSLPTPLYTCLYLCDNDVANDIAEKTSFVISKLFPASLVVRIKNFGKFITSEAMSRLVVYIQLCKRMSRFLDIRLILSKIHFDDFEIEILDFVLCRNCHRVDHVGKKCYAIYQLIYGINLYNSNLYYNVSRYSI